LKAAFTIFVVTGNCTLGKCEDEKPAIIASRRKLLVIII
jgi:hypothetical protein